MYDGEQIKKPQHKFLWSQDQKTAFKGSPIKSDKLETASKDQKCFSMQVRHPLRTLVSGCWSLLVKVIPHCWNQIICFEGKWSLFGMFCTNFCCSTICLFFIPVLLPYTESMQTSSTLYFPIGCQPVKEHKFFPSWLPEGHWLVFIPAWSLHSSYLQLLRKYISPPSNQVARQSPISH